MKAIPQRVGSVDRGVENGAANQLQSGIVSSLIEGSLKSTGLVDAVFNRGSRSVFLLFWDQIDRNQLFYKCTLSNPSIYNALR